jgi:hypothetical protein
VAVVIAKIPMSAHLEAYLRHYAMMSVNLIEPFALQQLLELLNDASNKVSKKITKLIKCQLQQWIAGLHSYIKAYLPDLCCES